MGAYGDTSPTTLLLETLSAVLAQVAEPEHLLKTILMQAVTQTHATRGVFVEVTDSGALNYRVLHRYDTKGSRDRLAHFSRTIFRDVLREHDGISVEDATSDPRYMDRDSVLEQQLVSVLCLPIKVDDTIAALLHLESPHKGHFDDNHLWFLRSLLNVAGPALKALRAAAESERRLREEVKESRAVLAREWSFGRFVGLSSCVRELEETIRKAAATEFPVLLLGETGTGKSLVARILHHAGSRSQKAFVTVFAPSLEKGMVEAEFFGHKKGAFTDAKMDRVGKVQAAERGTLFLDEIAELPLEIQPKLLRLLQEKTYERVGDAQERHANVRIIAATNRDMDEEIEAGRFRRDLHSRLNYLPIHIPPLRERKDDIPRLMRHCLDKVDVGRWVKVAAEAYTYLTQLDFAWPDNVRHLEQLAARMVTERKQDPFTPQDLERLLARRETSGGESDPLAPGPSATLDAGLPELLGQAERAWLEKAIRQYPTHTRAELAAKLKISESALYKKLRQYNIER